MANANWSNPQLTSTYTNFVSEVKNRDEDLALQFDGTTSTNIPTNTIRWDSTANRWKKWSGTAWGELTSLYALTGLSTTGAATIGTTLGVTGAITGSSTITGTALIPSGSSAPTNGIYLPSANTVAIATAGSGRVFVDGSGKLGIGVTPETTVHISAGNPSLLLQETDQAANSQRWGIQSEASILKFRAFNDAMSSAVDALALTRAGNVGIGTTSPGAQLDCQTSASLVANFTSSNASGGYVTVGKTGTPSIFGSFNAASGGGSLINADALYFRSSYGIGFNSTGAGGAVSAFLDTSGRLLIGTIASPAYQLQVSTDSAGKPSTNTWTIVSDERIKEDIELADLDICYEAIKAIPLKRYKWRDDVYTAEQVTDRRKLGWIAQDVEAVFPKAVSVHEFKYNQVYAETVIPAVEEVLGSDGEVITPAEPERIERELVSEDVIEDCKDLNADQVYAAMYGALQKLISKVETLEAEVAALKAA